MIEKKKGRDKNNWPKLSVALFIEEYSSEIEVEIERQQIPPQTDENETEVEGRRGIQENGGEGKIEVGVSGIVARNVQWKKGRIG